MAGLRVDIRSNISEVLSDLGGRTPQVIKRAISSGLNVGMRKAQGVTLKETARQLGIAQKHIRARMKRNNATRSRLEAVTTFNPRGLNPLNLGMSARQALKFYTGPRVSEPFIMTMPNGSRQVVVRLPESMDPVPKRSRTGARRTGRLPVASIRIFIGRRTVDRFVKAMANEGSAAFDAEFRRVLLANWD